MDEAGTLLGVVTSLASVVLSGRSEAVYTKRNYACWSSGEEVSVLVNRFSLREWIFEQIISGETNSSCIGKMVAMYWSFHNFNRVLETFSILWGGNQS